MVILRTRRVGGRQNGFTLIELMVTLSVAGVLLAIGLPSMSRLIANNRIATQTNEFVGALNLARSEAVRRSQGVSIRSSGGTIDFAGGWKVFNDATLGGAAPTAADVLREYSALNGRVTLKRVTRSAGANCAGTYADATSGDPFVVFNSRGGNNGGSATFFRVCDAGNTSVKGRIIQVATVGKVSLDCASATCP